MPWSFPPGGGGDGVGGLGAGVPFFVQQDTSPDGPGITSAFDFGQSMGQPDSGAIVSVMTNVTPGRPIYQTGVFGRPRQSTNPLPAGINNDPNIDIDFRTGGFLFTGGDIASGDGTDPATVTHTLLTAPPSVPIYCFSMANGNYYSRNNFNGFLEISSDGGATWAVASAEFLPGGSNDIDHRWISLDGTIAAIGSPLGISFTNDPDTGSAGEIGSLLTQAQTDGAFNADNNIFVWMTAASASRGAVFYTTDFAVANEVTVANNPFRFDATTGRRILYCHYVPQLEGWILVGDDNEQQCGFMPESEIGVIYQGVMRTEFAASRSSAMDGDGNVGVYCTDCRIIVPVLYG